MPTLTVRNLDEDTVRKLRIRAAENGRSAEAEHREILQQALGTASREPSRAEMADRLAAFRKQVAPSPDGTILGLLRETRGAQVRRLTGSDEGM
ncbi:FitA-like ribbon-helix-helix domain-containing protein [Aerophototrophica crusticola]|uniref:FitA-like ribbon-helix-helix domain-containing protein n=1 Tax=Aerophototrophica crusticola TaxID=1709002 RepID=UPI000952FDCC